jgi:hypothetical protein
VNTAVTMQTVVTNVVRHSPRNFVPVIFSANRFHPAMEWHDSVGFPAYA